MMVEQQPVRHPVPGRHWLGSMPPGPQACKPAGQTGGGGTSTQTFDEVRAENKEVFAEQVRITPEQQQALAALK